MSTQLKFAEPIGVLDPPLYSSIPPPFPSGSMDLVSIGGAWTPELGFTGTPSMRPVALLGLPWSPLVSVKAPSKTFEASSSPPLALHESSRSSSGRS